MSAKDCNTGVVDRQRDLARAKLAPAKHIALVSDHVFQIPPAHILMVGLWCNWLDIILHVAVFGESQLQESPRYLKLEARFCHIPQSVCHCKHPIWLVFDMYVPLIAELIQVFFRAGRFLRPNSI